MRYLRAERKAARRRGARSARGRADARARALRERRAARARMRLAPLVRLPEQVVRGVVVVAAELARHAPRLVVARAARVVGEDLVRALERAEVLGRRRVVAALIRVDLARERVVRLADLRRARRRVDLEQRVEVRSAALLLLRHRATESKAAGPPLCRDGSDPKHMPKTVAGPAGERLGCSFGPMQLAEAMLRGVVLLLLCARAAPLAPSALRRERAPRECSIREALSRARLPFARDRRASPRSRAGAASCRPFARANVACFTATDETVSDPPSAPDAPTASADEAAAAAVVAFEPPAMAAAAAVASLAWGAVAKKGSAP